MATINQLPLESLLYILTHCQDHKDLSSISQTSTSFYEIAKSFFQHECIMLFDENMEVRNPLIRAITYPLPTNFQILNNSQKIDVIRSRLLEIANRHMGPVTCTYAANSLKNLALSIQQKQFSELKKCCDHFKLIDNPAEFNALSEDDQLLIMKNLITQRAQTPDQDDEGFELNTNLNQMLEYAAANNCTFVLELLPMNQLLHQELLPLSVVLVNQSERSLEKAIKSAVEKNYTNILRMLPLNWLSPLMLSTYIQLAISSQNMEMFQIFSPYLDQLGPIFLDPLVLNVSKSNQPNTVAFLNFLPLERLTVERLYTIRNYASNQTKIIITRHLMDRVQNLPKGTEGEPSQKRFRA